MFETIVLGTMVVCLAVAAIVALIKLISDMW